MKSNGVINIRKPEGMTSHDVVSRMRRRLGIRRVGHTGTLDPMATGVLPVCFGKATRIIEYYEADHKTYTAELQLGVLTDTLDRTGEVLEERSFDQVTEEAVQAALAKMDGWVWQTPPKYSALKVNGKPLYKYAREGKDIDISDKRRQIFLSDMTLDALDLAKGTMKFTVTCSKGTYIRTICSDIGEELGCGAIMTSLVRSASGIFHIEDAVDLDRIMEMSDEELDEVILSADQTLPNLGVSRLHRNSDPFFLNGRVIEAKYMDVEEQQDRDDRLGKLVKVYSAEGDFLGIAELQDDGSMKPEKVLGSRE